MTQPKLNKGKVVVSVDKNGARKIDTKDYTLVETLLILDGCVKYLFAEVQKDLGLNGAKKGTADTPSGDNSQG